MLVAATPLFAVTAEADWDTSASNEIIGKYLQATQTYRTTPGETSMEVDIDASIPRLKESARLHALRLISQFGHISYRVMGFQGSNTVKSQVIARYLLVEQQSQANPKLAITPANYRFKLKGERITENGSRVYVFALAPRRSANGLFKGEMWLDQASHLPVYEKGHLSKSPSVFFKKVDFERAFAIQNGAAIPKRVSSTISTRVVGKVELNVNYSNYVQNEAAEFDGHPALVTDVFSQ